MSYLNKRTYTIVPAEAFKIVRNCPGCGRKMPYSSTGNFRVNANGNQLDVWLIYQCLKCRHTYNLAIYERVKPADLKREEYQSFLNNDQDTAFQYGLNREIFSKNKAEIIWDDICYDVILVDKKCYGKSIVQMLSGEKVQDKEVQGKEVQDKEVQDKKVPEKIQSVGAHRTSIKEEMKIFVVKNPYGLKVRTDRLAAGILQITRSKVKKLIKEGILEIQQDCIGKVIEIKIGGQGNGE